MPLNLILVLIGSAQASEEACKQEGFEFSGLEIKPG